MIWALFVARCRRLWPGRIALPAVRAPYLEEEEWSSPPRIVKLDSVDAIIGVVNRHARTLDHVAYDLAQATATLTFHVSPNPSGAPFEEVRLICTDVRSFGMANTSGAVCRGGQIWALRTERLAEGRNLSVILTKSGRMWAISLDFGGLSYDRSTRWPGK